MGILGSHFRSVEGELGSSTIHAVVENGPLCVAENVNVALGTTQVLDNVTVPRCEAGTLTALIGPNGAGKSTLLRCLAGLCKYSGTVRTDKSTVYLPQDPPPPSSLTVFESILLARQQSCGGLAALRVSGKTRKQVDDVLERLGLTLLASRRLTELSGGQRQLVGFAQAVVRRPKTLLLDEPTSALDLRNQLMLLEHIRSYARDVSAAVVMTIHDLGQAARFCDQVLVLSRGGVYATGEPDTVITEDLLGEVYGVSASVQKTNTGGLAIEAARALVLPET